MQGWQTLLRQRRLALPASAAAATALWGSNLWPAPTADSRKTFRSAEVAKHSAADDVWVTYDGGVYDVTPFVAQHPGGGARLLMAAGGALEPFWQVYQQHTSSEVQQLLSQYRIGDLDARDAAEVKSAQSDDPYAGEPPRAAALVVHKDKPFNAEVPRSMLEAFITPTPVWYVRHHHPVPDIDPEGFRLGVALNRGSADEDREGPAEDDERSVELSLDDLRNKYPRMELVATMQCGGNRRAELNEVAQTQGLKWQAGAISTARWAGAPLRKVLQTQLGITDVDSAEAMGIHHVQFAGVDAPFDASIPIAKALDPRGDVLLAYEMNGEALGREHGGPLRVVVPGYIGARSVKWVERVTAAKEEAYSTWQRGVPYKMFSSSVTSFALPEAKPEDAAGVMEMPVQSALMTPAPGARLQRQSDGTVPVSGYAYSGGGRSIARVDVSSDGGKSWVRARLTEGKSQPFGRAWAWTFFEASLPVEEGEGELLCRAVDSAANSQPERRESVWNLRGILNNSWHRVPVTVVEGEAA